MTKSILEITYTDGRSYKVFTANRNQYKNILKSKNRNPKIKDIKEIQCGIHTTKQYLDILEEHIRTEILSTD